MHEQNALPGGLTADPPKAGWMRAVAKIADYCLGVSMYVFYPIILLIVLIDVVGRNFFDAPISWSVEGSGLCLIVGIFLAVSRVELDRDHILLDILYANYKPKMMLICDIATRVFAALWMMGATVRSAIEIHTAYVMRESGSDFRYPFWPMRVIMTFGFLILTLALLYNVVECYKKLQIAKGGK